MQYILCGCKTNQYESNAIMQEFLNSGYEIVDFEEKADIYIVNTCTVTNMSDRKSRQVLRRAKNQNKNSVLIATGCYAQINKNLINEIPEIDIILGNNEKKDVIKYIENFESRRKAEVTDISQKKEFLENRRCNFFGKDKGCYKN